MPNVTSTSRSQFPSGVAVLRSTSLSINVQSALVQGESDLHHYFESVTIELRTKTFLHCWDNQSVDTDGIEQGAEIFGGMMGKACEGLPDTEFQSAQFALLLHISIKLSHRLTLPENKTQGDFNRIIDNRSMNFDQMQTAVFAFFDQKRTVLPKAVPAEQTSAPVYPQIHPRFEDLPVKELKLPPTPPQAQPVKEQSKPKKKAVAAQPPTVAQPEVKLPEVKPPKIELPKTKPSMIERPKRKAPRLHLPSFNFSRIGHAAVKAVDAATRGIYQGVSGVASRLKNSFYIGPLNNAWQGVKRGILNGASDVATRLKSSFYVGPLNDAYQAVNRAAWLGKHAVMDAASAVARCAKAVWNGAKQLFSGYDRV